MEHITISDTDNNEWLINIETISHSTCDKENRYVQNITLLTKDESGKNITISTNMKLEDFRESIYKAQTKQ